MFPNPKQLNAMFQALRILFFFQATLTFMPGHAIIFDSCLYGRNINIYFHSKKISPGKFSRIWKINMYIMINQHFRYRSMLPQTGHVPLHSNRFQKIYLFPAQQHLVLFLSGRITQQLPISFSLPHQPSSQRAAILRYIGNRYIQRTVYFIIRSGMRVVPLPGHIPAAFPTHPQIVQKRNLLPCQRPPFSPSGIALLR